MIDEKKEKLIKLFTDMTLKYSASEETCIYEYSTCIKEECENLEKEVEEAIEEFKNVLYTNDVVQTGYIKLEYKNQTNGDRIRAMSDEELADLFYSFQNLEDEVKFCKNKGVCNDILDDGNDIPDAMCKQCLVEWLQSEVEEANNPEPCETAQPSWKDQMLMKFLGRRQ